MQPDQVEPLGRVAAAPPARGTRRRSRPATAGPSGRRSTSPRRRRRARSTSRIQTRKRGPVADPQDHRDGRHHQEVAAVDQADQHAVPRAPRCRGGDAPVPTSSASACRGRRATGRSRSGTCTCSGRPRSLLHVGDRVGLVVHLRGGVRRGVAAAVVVGEQDGLEGQPVDHHLPPGGPAATEHDDGQERKDPAVDAEPVGRDPLQPDEEQQPQGVRREGRPTHVVPAPTGRPHPLRAEHAMAWVDVGDLLGEVESAHPAMLAARAHGTRFGAMTTRQCGTPRASRAATSSRRTWSG